MPSVSRVEAARIDDVGPLWQALHTHHAAGAAHLESVARFRSPQESWAIRRGQYLEYLGGDLPSALFLAEVDGRVVGYAMVRGIPAGPTLETDDVIGHLESLVVLPEYRSQGLGRRLLDAVWQVQREWGITVTSVNVMAGNLRTEQVYRRMGMVPFTTTHIGAVE